MSDRLAEATAEIRPKRGFGAWISGRSRRRNYWAWVAPTFVTAVIIAVVAPGLEIVLGPVLLLAWIRRLHDLGATGWIAPLVNIALGIIGWLEAGVLSPGGEEGAIQGLLSIVALVVMGLLPGQRHANRFGPPPGKPAIAETFA